MKSLPLLCLAVGLPIAAHAAAKSFDGDTNENFQTATNWTGNTAPASGDQLTIGGSTNYAVTLNSAFTLANEAPAGTLFIAAGSSLTVDNVILTLQQAPAKVSIAGTLNLVGAGAGIVTNAENGPKQGTFELAGGSIRIEDWNNSIRSSGGAAGAPTIDFTSPASFLSITGIAANEQTNYTGKFGAFFFGLNGTQANWTDTPLGSESQEISGFKLVRTDDFANGASTVSVAAIPEPSTYGFVTAGAWGLIAMARQRRLRAGGRRLTT